MANADSRLIAGQDLTTAGFDDLADNWAVNRKIESFSSYRIRDSFAEASALTLINNEKVMVTALDTGTHTASVGDVGAVSGQTPNSGYFYYNAGVNKLIRMSLLENEIAKGWADTAETIVNGVTRGFATFAEALAVVPVDGYFDCWESGIVRRYKRTDTTPFYIDQGDAAAPVSQAQLALKSSVGSDLGGGYTDTAVALPISTAVQTALDLKPTITSLAGNGGAATIGLPQVGKLDKAVRYITPEMRGAAGNDTGDDAAAIQAANDYAKAQNIPLYLFGPYRTNSTVTLDCYCVVSHNTTITRTLTAATDLSEVVRFVGTGSDGQFRQLTGRLRAQLSGKPATTQVSAHAFVFEGVINALMGGLYAGHCAYGFVNDPSVSGDTGRFWGNTVGWLYCRGCVQGYMYMPTPGTGAHTENTFGMVYFNGKEVSNATLLPKEDIPINVSNAEGWVFNCLNFEWTEINAASANFGTIKGFIRAGLMSNIIIHAFHPEGLTIPVSNADFAMFYPDSTGSDECSIKIGSYHINNWSLSLGATGTFSHVAATTASDGRVEIDYFSGKSNTIVDDVTAGSPVSALNRVHLKNQTQSSGNSVVVVLGEGSNYGDFGFSNFRKGTVVTDLSPDIWIGSTAWVNDVQIVVGSGTTTLAMQKAHFARLTTASPTALATISASARFTNERYREMVLYNETGGTVTLVKTGNLRGSMQFPLQWFAGGTMRVIYDLTNDTVLVVAVDEPAKGSWVVAKSAVAVPHTGDTTEFTFATVSIPANAIGPNGQVEIFALWSYPNSANTKTLRTRFGGTLLTSNAQTTTASFQTCTRFANRNSVNSQVSNAGSGFGSSTSAVSTAAVDTTTATDVTITGQLASAGETITLESYLVRVTYGA